MYNIYIHIYIYIYIKAPTGDWEELNREAYVCNVCLQNNFRV